MSDDIVARLREPYADYLRGMVVEDIKWEAADEIERLRELLHEARWYVQLPAEIMDKFGAGERELLARIDAALKGDDRE